MKKLKWTRVLKITGGLTIFLLILLLAGAIYINKIVAGSGTGTLPEGYKLIEANGYKFSTKISGNKNDIPVIFLHGFPESSVMWERLMLDLNKIGYYTIAPDQRGYSFAARPEEINQYQISYLATDVMAIADSLGINKFHLVCHDWGSAVGWQIAANYPERLYSFTSMSIPHLEAFSRAYREDSLQFKASGYMRDFQTKKIPEFMLAKNNYEILRSIWSEHEEGEVNSYINILSQKNALTAAVNWYRANFSIISEGTDLGMITVPVLFMWGKNDDAIARSGVEWTRDYVTGYYRFVELNSTHWLIQDSYERVQNEITSHLAKFK
jgi:pimeloyl-ACP methyl ester carboxylesterase